ncbi:SDR family NAD(P)-dependent oxidoreductase [Succinatimonas hippei]|uniref:SDR family NAD(P)-dependent oxidoreductase n=1 Tax=Succinatimonas hippei TaxID=626938 RepID=UPI0026E994BE|nr:SDR family oxidoreductase [Succinatimonas hippei]
MNSYLDGLFSLKGHVGIITGASKGIGLGIAEVLVQAGAKVYNFSRSQHQNNGFDFKNNLIDLKVDIQDENAVKAALNEVIATEGQLDFLINNAGISFKKRAEEFPDEEYAKIQKTDLESVFKLCKACFPYLKQSKYVGRIISITSMSAYMGFNGVVPYCMMKSGLMGLTKGLAEEWHDDNILVNSIAPGWVLTEINAKMFADNPDRKAAALNKPILKKFIDPREIGHMALFLLGNASLSITGHDFPVDGGAVVHGF